MKYRQIVLSCALLIMGCSEGPTAPDKGSKPVSTGTPPTLQLVSFELSPLSPGGVASVRWRLLAGVAGTLLDSGVVSTGTTTTVSVQVTPGQYALEWPDSVISVSGVLYRVRGAPPTQTLIIGQATSVLRLSTKYEALTSAIVFRAKFPSSPTTISFPTIIGRISQGSSAPTTFTASPTYVSQLLTAGATYHVSWPATTAVSYGGIMHRLVAIDTIATVTPEASLTPVEVGPQYELSQGGVFLSSTGLPAAAAAPQATASWRTADGVLHTTTCVIGPSATPCESLPTSYGITLTYAKVIVNGVTYSPSPATSELLLPPRFQTPPAIVVAYSPE